MYGVEIVFHDGEGVELYRRWVKGYSNTLAAPEWATSKAIAKWFPSRGEAERWAKAYLPAHRWVVTEC